MLWKQNLASIDIQRIYRGMKEFKSFPGKLMRFRETKEAKKEREDRMR